MGGGGGGYGVKGEDAPSNTHRGIVSVGGLGGAAYGSSPIDDLTLYKGMCAWTCTKQTMVLFSLMVLRFLLWLLLLLLFLLLLLWPLLLLLLLLVSLVLFLFALFFVVWKSRMYFF